MARIMFIFQAEKEKNRMQYDAVKWSLLVMFLLFLLTQCLPRKWNFLAPGLEPSEVKVEVETSRCHQLTVS